MRTLKSSRTQESTGPSLKSNKDYQKKLHPYRNLYHTSLPFNMSKRKGVSAQEKRDRLLTMLRDSKRPWSTKEVVSHFFENHESLLPRPFLLPNKHVVGVFVHLLFARVGRPTPSFHPSSVVFIFVSADLTDASAAFPFFLLPTLHLPAFLFPPSPTLLYRKNPPRASDSTPWQCPKSCPLCSMTIWP